MVKKPDGEIEAEIEGGATSQSTTALTVTPSRGWRPQDADHEMEKIAVRNRVRNSRVGENTTFIPARHKPTVRDIREAKVAVYARVSTSSIEQVSSIENQTRYYTEKIASTPGWELEEIYSDEGKSGTSMKRREAFQRMLQDAALKKMDLIVCASVSRFARNVSDCVTQVRKLRTSNPSHPVGVFFETENIYTLDPESDNAFKMHAMLADWESANKSRRMILSYDQRICTGQYPVSDLLGYRHTKDGDLVIVEDEAITVRFIYLAFLAGYSYADIADILTAYERKTLTGRTEWNAAMVRNIMTNERRWGDLSARKTIVIDYVEGKVVKNRAERDAAYVVGHHKGIVSPAIAKAAQLLSSSNRHQVETIPDVSVITSGGLKGFVSVCPAYSGVDVSLLENLCFSVYDEEELADIRKRASIMVGDAHSQVLDFQFTGYQVPHGVYFLNNSSAAMTLSKGRIKFSTAGHKKLNQCKFVEILYHPILQMIAIRECSPDHPGAICWEDKDGNFIPSFAAREFTQAIYDQLHWIKDYSFKFRGVTKERNGYRIMLFYLDEPQIILSKRARKKQTDTSPVQYIPYTETEQAPENGGTTGFAYPDRWTRYQVGMSYALRMERDKLLNNLCAQDIQTLGEIAFNPLVGEIPTLYELEDELEDLLLQMSLEA